MNAHFSNAVNAVAFTWGTQRTYHAAQFGEAQFAYEYGRFGIGPYGPHKLKALLPWPGDVSESEMQRQDEPNTRLRTNHYLDTRGPPTQLPDFLQEPFEGNETGPDVWTDEDEAMMHHLIKKKWSGRPSP